MSVTTMTPIEQIAETIAGWGDGWEFRWNPDDRGRRARIVREQSNDVLVEIEIHEDRGLYFVFTGASCRPGDGRWQRVSVSVRNPVNRKALDYINAERDNLEADTHGETDND